MIVPVDDSHFVLRFQGYGLVFPSHSGTAAEGKYRSCAGIQILCTFESFVGILFAVCFCFDILVSCVVNLSITPLTKRVFRVSAELSFLAKSRGPEVMLRCSGVIRL